MLAMQRVYNAKATSVTIEKNIFARSWIWLAKETKYLVRNSRPV